VRLVVSFAFALSVASTGECLVVFGRLVNETICVQGNIAEKRESTIICQWRAWRANFPIKHTSLPPITAIITKPGQTDASPDGRGLAWLGFARQAFFLSVLSSGAYHTVAAPWAAWMGRRSGPFSPRRRLQVGLC
jgi:hypothetical protein